MTLTVPLYRKDYQGEVVTDGRQTPPARYFVKPRKLFYREPAKIPTRAMVIGNGVSRINETFDLFFRTNAKRPIQGYKITYACNGAAWDMNVDNYIVTNRILMGHIRDQKLWSQFHVPSDMYIDYKIPNMIPFVNGLDAGSYAAFLAAFDGHSEVWMFGFDRQHNNTNNNVYADKPTYDSTNTKINSEQWDINLANICKCYSDVKFYRVGVQNGSRLLESCENFRDVNYNAAVKLGDF